MQADGITVAYSGVHEAYQLALAAHEVGLLDHFYCSLFAGRRKWGQGVARLLGENALQNRFIDGLPPDRVWENPWPFLRYRIRGFLRLNKGTDWEAMNIAFDSWTAKRLYTESSRIFVGVETCCANALEVAREREMTSIVDWPGIATHFLNSLAVEAADEFGLTTNVSADSQLMDLRKQKEMELAHLILTCSEFQAKTLQKQGAPTDKLRVVPLWVDGGFWRPLLQRGRGSVPLRVLFAGKINIRKGVPYLVRATRACGVNVVLTLVGGVDDELRRFLSVNDDTITVLPSCSKVELRKHYCDHDVVVLPSLGDSFGFVALEAMSCGRPVIVTENCGVPVPDPSWRIPIMNSDAVAKRLSMYADDRELCHEHGLIAADFARQYTPERYRDQVKCMYRHLLN